LRTFWPADALTSLSLPSGVRVCVCACVQWFPAMRAALQFRAKLVPYLYTSARRAYDSGISIVSPLYYYWPQYREMFTYKTQYMLGESIMVRPWGTPRLCLSQSWIRCQLSSQAPVFRCLRECRCCSGSSGPQKTQHTHVCVNNSPSLPLSPVPSTAPPCS
jgi:hypothetical protein